MEAPPPPLDASEERAESALVKLWITPRGEQRERVVVELEAEAYDASLTHDYELPVGDDAEGHLSADLLCRLIARDVIRAVAAELRVPYEKPAQKQF